MTKIVLYIATSQDGYIADKSGGVEWLPQPGDDAQLEVVGYKTLMERIDTIVMGSKSYRQIKSFGDWGWADKQTYVFTSDSIETNEPYIHRTSESPLEFVSKARNGGSTKDIWLLGGGELARSFAKEKLIDEIILTIVPKTLGEGIPLGLNLDDFDVVTEKSLMDGMVQRTYFRNT